MPKTAKSFDDLITFTFAEGALSARAKELIALGISLAVKCEPCMNYHIEKARVKGASEEELLEAMGVGFEMGLGQLIPPLRRVLASQFGGRGDGRPSVDAGLVRDQSREARLEPDEYWKEESRNRMWTRY
jgi:AhpD family alkylhydroperoxidase